MESNDGQRRNRTADTRIFRAPPWTTVRGCVSCAASGACMSRRVCASDRGVPRFLFSIRTLQCDNRTEFPLCLLLSGPGAGHPSSRHPPATAPPQHGQGERSHRVDQEACWGLHGCPRGPLRRPSRMGRTPTTIPVSPWRCTGGRQQRSWWLSPPPPLPERCVTTSPPLDP